MLQIIFGIVAVNIMEMQLHAQLFHGIELLNLTGFKWLLHCVLNEYKRAM